MSHHFDRSKEQQEGMRFGSESLIPYYFKQAEADGVIFCMRGPMSQGVVEMLEHVLKKRTAQELGDHGKSLRVFSVFVEQVQNIIRYSEERVQLSAEGGDAGVGMVIVGHRQGQFYVSCGNLIKAEDQPRLQQQLQLLQGMDKDQLRAYFKERGRSPAPVGSKGAGLGLIEIVRRASAFDYFFTPWEGGLLLFTLQVTI
ncbi:SiaB family protein kinase [Candidatus Magnetaquicoccus inordinatus]|uniref:SiaB family protein kinase n=1 Tax=Candidatus Magnetaquicoccus inordinatus TaxID=2496818 RepID=UPI00102AC7A0|nr:SiaB family protein kinase [Candidatus Magnetaquicoccus inordinatus]